MGRVAKLTDAEVQEKLASLEDWTIENGKLHRELRFDSFVEAFSFMSAMALVSEKLDHHAEWFNVYNRVVIDLTTHDAAGISQKDFDWATQADRLMR